MLEGSAKSADANVSLFSMSGTRSDDARADVTAMVATGMTAEQALDILLAQAAAPGPQLGAHTLAQSSGRQLAATVLCPPGLRPAPTHWKIG